MEINPEETYKTPIDFNEGTLILVNKPYKLTSFGAVKKVRWLTKAKKVGHAGTLDPLATGLLVLCTGKFTKKIDEYQGLEKEYTGTFILGATTPSFDLETEVDQHFDTADITDEAIQQAAEGLTGFIQQAPPIYSAIKIDGKRAYSHARKGEEVEMKKREVEVKEFEITSINLPEIKFRIVCSKGTYIRSLARDLGEALENGAYLSELCRTRIGNLNLQNAWELDKFEAFMKEHKSIEV